LAYALRNMNLSVERGSLVDPLYVYIVAAYMNQEGGGGLYIKSGKVHLETLS
jgi:hypothetical protein